MTSIALIGYGPWGRNYHNSIDSLDSVKLHSICRLHPEKIPSGIARRVPVITDDVSTAIEGADAVVIATPPGVRKDIAIECLNVGKPILLEKPLALNMEDARAILDKANEVGIDPLVCYTYLFHPAFETLLNFVGSWSSVEIGSKGGGNGPFRDDYDSLMDWGPHDIAMAISVMSGSPKNGRIFKNAAENGGSIYEIVIENEGGKDNAHLMVGNGFSDKNRRFAVQCGERLIVFNEHHRHKLIVDGRPVKCADDKPLKRAIIYLHRYVQSGIVDWRFKRRLHEDVMRVLTMPLSNSSYDPLVPIP